MKLLKVKIVTFELDKCETGKTVVWISENQLNLGTF